MLGCCQLNGDEFGLSTGGIDGRYQPRGMRANGRGYILCK